MWTRSSSNEGRLTLRKRASSTTRLLCLFQAQSGLELQFLKSCGFWLVWIRLDSIMLDGIFKLDAFLFVSFLFFSFKGTLLLLKIRLRSKIKTQGRDSKSWDKKIIKKSFMTKEFNEESYYEACFSTMKHAWEHQSYWQMPTAWTVHNHVIGFMSANCTELAKTFKSRGIFFAPLWPS